MKERNKNLSEAEVLRQKAEDLYRSQASKLNSISGESDILKLNHELSVHQIELEIQNDELISAKAELEEAVEKYTELYDFAPTGYITLSREGQILSLNLSASKMIGKERIKLDKKFFNSFLKDNSKRCFNDFLNEIFNSEDEKTCELTLLKNGNIPIIIFLIGIKSKSGESCDISIIDINNRKIAERNLKIVNKELEQSLNSDADKDLFISVLAHDLRNPLGVLLGYAELLMANFRSHEINNAEKLIDEISHSAQNTYSLLEDLLKWSRMRNGKYPFTPQKLSFRKICDDTISLFEPFARTKKIKIICDENMEFSLIADEDMLKAIIRNLISNAVKFTNLNGTITISGEKRESDVLFSVSDNGIGIESEKLEHLFEISHYDSTPGTANEKGTGLGLLLCKEFVAKHGGKIWAETKIGNGSVFYFIIPTKSEVTVKDIETRNVEEKHIEELKILIADDNAALSMILGTMVKSYCKEILYATDGTDAVDICMKNPDIDLILMDYYMPTMNGYEASRLIRKFNQKVIIIIETANDLLDVTQSLPREGINDFFFKPYSRIFLNELITKYFSNKNIPTV